MDESNRKRIWKIIQKHGDFIKDRLQPHPHHPKGRNPYAHICSLITDHFNCSYKDVQNSRVEDLEKFILKIER